MARTVLTDIFWAQILSAMQEKGCYDAKNSRAVMEGILWKLRTGAPWRDIPFDICNWKTAFNRFNRWSKKGLWENFFLTYEEKLIRSGLSQTELTCALTSMRVELGLEKKEPLENLEVDPLLKYTWPPMRMEIRSILKSLGVKYTTPNQHPKLSPN